MELRIRPARPSDYSLIERLYPDLGSGDAPPPTDRWVASDMESTTVCEGDGAPVGFIRGQILDGEGYVRQIVIERSARRRGVGRALLGEFAQRLRSLDYDRWRLNVDPGNGPAITLYEKLGFSISHECVAMDFPWEWLDGLSVDSTEEHVREPKPAEFPDLERQLALPPGQLADQARMGSVHLRVIGGALPRGLAAFDTNFPGCFPFRAETYPLAIELLRALRSLAQSPNMRVVLENASDLDAAFLAAGARPHLRFLQMIGTVPQSDS